MEKFWQDLRYGLRMLLRQPGFTLVAVLTLALGIGANTAIFTLINAVFLQSLPVEDPARLVQVFTTDEKQSNVAAAGFSLMPMSRQNYEDFRDQNDVFSGLTAVNFVGLTLTGRGDPQQLNGQIVSGNYFDVLGVKAAYGRTFLREESAGSSGVPVVVLSHGLWKRQFGSDPNLVGQALTLNGLPYTVVGIMPEGFKGTFAVGNPDLVWVPMAMHEHLLTGVMQEFYESRRALWLFVVGRLKPGVPLEQAEATLKTIARRLEQAYPEDNEKRTVALRPLTGLDPNQQGQFRLAGVLLMTVVAFVLLIACVNIANLLLARATGREKEIAIRTALGAGRTRLIRQLLTESVLLALMGGLVGLLFAIWGRDLLWAFRPPFLNANSIDLSLDQKVLWFTLGIALLTGLAFGLAPALQATKPNLTDTLKEGGRGTGVGSGRRRLRSSLVVLEVALALVALIAAGLFVKSMRNAQQVDPGFETRRLVMMFFDLSARGLDQAQSELFYDQTIDRLRSLPGVESSTVASNFLLGGGFMRSVTPEGQEPPPGSRGILTLTNIVTPKHLDTLGLRLLRGRNFTDDDRENTFPVALINQAMAKRFWPTEEALGKRFRLFSIPQLFEVVGIVSDSTQVNIGETPQPLAYLPLKQHYVPAIPGVVLFVRTAGDPATVMGTVRQEVQALDRNLPLQNVNTVADVLNQALWAPRMGAALLSLFAVLALALAAVGIYGVMAYSVSQRTHEIGVRMALGAQPNDILRLVVRQGMTLTLVGLGLGLAAAFGLTRFVRSLLFDVAPTDPLTFATVPALLALVALLACYIPARRATRVHPMIALRYE